MLEYIVSFAMNLRDVYAEKAVSQIARLLGNQDRNPFSPTYGCFHRDYWLDKTSDFPDAVPPVRRAFTCAGLQARFSGNIYKGKKKILDWTVAGLRYWVSLQHPDGSFDEFYHMREGWVGPSAFTTFTTVEAFQLLRDEIPASVATEILGAVERAAQFVISAKSRRRSPGQPPRHGVPCRLEGV